MPTKKHHSPLEMWNPSNGERQQNIAYELDKFFDLYVWESVNKFLGAKALGKRWMFAIKPLVGDTIQETFQARYVVKGFNQQIVID